MLCATISKRQKTVGVNSLGWWLDGSCGWMIVS